ncbi:hypothetical protein PybrP1_006580 [[Pythium] brassicae (nom. inval.)]|nr:hypothetical protein PybrP1_006580 [[Pythium] brassicae (nom. inval.)]
MSARTSNNSVSDEMETLSESPSKQLGDAEPAQQEEQPPLREVAQHHPPRVHPTDDSLGPEKSDSRPRLHVITKGVSSPSEDTSDTRAKDEDAARHPGFGIEPGTLELVRVARREWTQPQNLPLPVAAANNHAPIISEFTRPWSALRLKQQPLESLPRARASELPQDQSLLKNYEPRFSVGEHTFPASEVTTPSLFDARVAVEDALALLVTMNLRLALGSIEPLFCRLVIYDISLGCRVTEEFSFSLPGAVDLSSSAVKAAPAGALAKSPPALFYVLPNHLPQHLFLVLKVAKVLAGDGESATAPYCSPEKHAAESEQNKLVERAADCCRRLGRYRQPLAWGAIALQEGASRCMTLFRQRATMSDEQRLPLLPDAVRGALKEKVVPCACEFDLEVLDDQRLVDAKFQSSGKTRSLSKNPLPTAPVLEILDPFSICSTSETPSSLAPLELHAPPNADVAVAPIPEAVLPSTRVTTAAASTESAMLQCREIQPFCHPSVTSVYGLTGSGPVAVAYINALYVYPIHLEKFQFRNVAIRVQLLAAEAESVGGLDAPAAASGAVLRALYAPDGGVASAAYTLVNYHQKNPQFENEVKMCLPERLTPAHHVLFSFYHVHCKKLQPGQPQQELVGYAVLPVLQKDGTVLQDNNHVVNVVAAPVPSKGTSASASTATLALPPGYVAAARSAGLDITKTTLAVRTRALSSVHSQDRTVAALLQRFHTRPVAAADDDERVAIQLLRLRQAGMPSVRCFLLPIAKFVLGYLRFGTAAVRWAAFRALLSVLEKASWTPQRSLKHDLNPVLHGLVHLVVDERAVEDFSSAPAEAEDATRQPRAVFDALLREWLLVLQDDATADDSAETKRLSLAYSNTLLQLVLKSLATHTPTPSLSLLSSAKTPTLPLVLSDDDDALMERVLRELVASIDSSSAHGLLLQKEVNRSVAHFCRGLFLVARNDVPARAIARYMGWAAARESDANVLVHLLFPFLRILVDFEFFAVVNGARTLARSRSRSRSRSSSIRRASFEPTTLTTTAVAPRAPWLATLVVERLLSVADEQKEEKIRCDAVRLLRRMFVAQAYNPYHQSPDEQEAIALLYYPLVASLAQFTADGKLLCSSGTSTQAAVALDVSDKSHELKRELLVCVVHLLSSVSTRFLARFFQQCDVPATLPPPPSATRNTPLSSPIFPLSPTGSLLHYRRVVEERNGEHPGRTRRSILKISGQERRAHAAGDPAAREQPFDEVRVHACLALIRHSIETFLVDEAALPPGAALWQHLLSPDLVTREGRLSLLDIEMHLNHRRISRQQIMTDAFSGAGGATAGATPASCATLSSSSHSSGRSSSTGAVGSGSGSGMWSPSPKLVRAGSSNALAATGGVGATRAPSRSLPRNWGKSYSSGSGGARRTSSGLVGDGGGASLAPSVGPGDDDIDPESYALHIRYLHRITAVTTLRALRTAVDQFEWVIRLIEAPFECRRESPEPAGSDGAGVVTVEQAYALLGALIDLLFLLIRRANAIETLHSNFDGDLDESASDDDENDDNGDGEGSGAARDDGGDRCFLTDLFEYLARFLARFQRALFACRIAELPRVHDRCRVHTLLAIAATGKMRVVRQHAAALLCSLAALCFAQTGSFSLVARPVVQVFSAEFFAPTPGGAPPIPTESLREAVDEMRQRALADDSASLAFRVQFKELLRGLVAQIKAFEMWQAAVASPAQLRDYEEVEDALYRVAGAISPFWLLGEKTQWLDALQRLHVARDKFAEAACCRLECLAFTRLAVGEPDSSRDEFRSWEVRELVLARELAEKAEWRERQLALSEQLLAQLKAQRRYPEYVETLKYLERVVGQHAELDEPGTGASHAFYRVAVAGDCVSPHASRLEFVYKRSRFLSLGEFVSEMKAVLRAKYPVCERVDVVPEPKPLVGDEPNMICMRVTAVEPVDDVDATEFRFALPFTLGGGGAAYGATREQMKRVTYLAVAQPFPCALSRQRVVRRREEVRSPIATAMDDIRKRCGLLQAEVGKERHGRTDLKTLTLVLKGSVDTHVHGGVPEVVESFLAPEAGAPPLLDARGAVMGAGESASQRQELAHLLVHFLALCWQCLLISREAFRRASSLSSSNLVASAAGSAAAAPAPLSLLSLAALEGSEWTVPPPFARSGSSSGLSPSPSPLSSAVLSPPLADDDSSAAPLSPLQLAFETSFVALVELVQTRVPLSPEAAADVVMLVQQMQSKGMGSAAGITGTSNTCSS